MQTKHLCLTATIGLPETLSRDYHGIPSGLSFGKITYLITGVPVDVPIFEVVNVAKRILSCRSNAFNVYDFAWPSMVCVDRR